LTSKEDYVRRRLSGLIAVVEIASVGLLLLLIRQRVIPDNFGLLLIFLFPVGFGLHVTEEFIFPGGFIGWDNIFRPRYTETPGSYYVKVNAIPMVGSLLVGLGAFDYEGKYSFFGIRAWLAFLTFMAWNALFHIRGSIHTRRYSPGVVTGVLVFIPLATASYIHFKAVGVTDGLSLVLCAAVALTIQPILDLIKRVGLRKHA